jgi:hypothetical protein
VNAWRNPRRIVLAGMGLVLAAVVVLVLVASDPFAGSSKPSGVADNTAATSLATVTQRPLSSQTPVTGTLGYAGASSVRMPSGTPPSAVAQAEQSVTAAEAMLQTASASLAADTSTLSGLQATLWAAREKESVDCAGEGAAESASTASAPGGEDASDGASPGGASAGLCTGDVETVSSDRQGASTAAVKVAADRTSLASAQAGLTRAQESLSAARSSEAVYGPSSTFTQLPSVGQVISRGQTLYAISGRPVVLQYGSPATRELPLGSVVFEPGPVRVTSVTPTVGASVAPGPVLDVSSTVPQVTIQLSAAQQSSVKVGDQVTITLPDEQTTPGVVSSVGMVAKSPSSKGGGGGGGGGGGEGGEEGPTIEVQVAPSDPSAIGHLDEAPVTVAITTASVPSTLVVPVDALLALAGGGYAVEVVEGHAHRLEAVSLGLFDDAEGLVQVSGREVAAGQRVVVPAS